MFANYIAKEVNYKDLGDNKLEIDGKIYAYNDGVDPEYQNDGVLNISYYPLFDEDNEPTNMVLAFDATGNDDPQEWSDQYDADNPKVIAFN